MRADFGLYGSGLQIASYPLEVRMIEPQPFKLYKAGTLLHGTKADLAVGDLLVAGYESNFEAFPVLVTDGDRRRPPSRQDVLAGEPSPGQAQQDECVGHLDEEPGRHVAGALR